MTRAYLYGPSFYKREDAERFASQLKHRGAVNVKIVRGKENTYPIDNGISFFRKGKTYNRSYTVKYNEPNTKASRKRMGLFGA